MIDLSYHTGRQFTKKDEKKHLMCYIDMSVDTRICEREDTSNRVREDYNNLSNERGVVDLIVKLCIDDIFDVDKFSILLQEHMSKDGLIEFSTALQKAAFERMG